MTMGIYAIVSTSVFLVVYLTMPLVVRWATTKWLTSISGKLGTQLSGGIRKKLEKAQSGVLPELKGQVIAHLVEPWIEKFTQKCADMLAAGGGQSIAEKYTEILTKAILQKRLMLSAIISHTITLAAMLGYYLRGVL